MINLIFIYYCDIMLQIEKLDYSKYSKETNLKENFSIGYFFFIMICIALAIFLIIFLIKKFLQPINSNRNKKLILLETLYLGNKNFLHVLEFYDKILLISNSPQNVQLITEFYKKLEENNLKEEKNNLKEEKNNLKEKSKFSKILENLIIDKSK